MHHHARTSFRTAVALVGACIAAVVAMAGCSGSPGGSASGGAAAKAAPPAAADQAGGDTARRPQDSGGAKSGTGSSPARAALTARSIVRTAELVVRTKDVQAAADRAAGLVQGGDGYVASQQTNGDIGNGAGLSSVNLVLRVPVDDFDRVARQLLALGTPLADKRDAKDVTDEVVDVDSRVASQQKSIQRLRTLLGQAKTVGEVMQVETELTNRETELESLQARYAALSSQAALSTIRVTFEAPEVASTTSSGGGFLSGLGAGWNAFVTVVQALLTAVGALIPFLLGLALVVGLPGWFVLRARARRRAPTSTPTPPPAAT
ncbi:MAG TPA: DUF4349 domain-containing protein [Actinopolymorphaceae bacterium]|nr:DUF4349 domain-containing protein [Actinopolymorphaceae bacterium]